MNFETIRSPLAFIGSLVADKENLKVLGEYESWWHAEGQFISDAVDRAGTPHLRMFDQFGERRDEILFSPDYWRMLRKGYETGAIWRAGESNSLKMHYLIDYVTCFFDAGLGCPYIVSLSTTVPLRKYGSPELQQKFLPQLLRHDGANWQGATWMTEVKGGSDLGANVETMARKSEPRHIGVAGAAALGARTSPSALSAQRELDQWLLTGDKYFASNVGAELGLSPRVLKAVPWASRPSITRKMRGPHQVPKASRFFSCHDTEPTGSSTTSSAASNPRSARAQFPPAKSNCAT